MASARIGREVDEEIMAAGAAGGNGKMLGGGVSTPRQEFRFSLDDESSAIILEGDGSERFHGIVVKIALRQQVTVRAAGCIKKLRVVRT